SRTWKEPVRPRASCASRMSPRWTRARTSWREWRQPGVRWLSQNHAEGAAGLTQAQVVVVGAGQAGLAVSHQLRAAGVDHVVLERGRVGETWRGRWDSFCLVTPNWTMSLPGFSYTGDDPDGFDPRDEIVHYLERYANSVGAPVHHGGKVESLESDRDDLL